MTPEQLQTIIDCPRTFLSRGYKIHERIAAKRERINSWRARAESITVQLSHTGGMSGGGYKQGIVANSVISMVSLEEEIAAEIEELTATEFEVGQAIRELLTDTRYSTLLELRYLNQLRMEEIAARLGYAFRWAQRLHGKAIRKMKEAALSALKTR